MATRKEVRLRVRESINEVLFDPPPNAPSLASGGAGALSGVYKYAVVFAYADGRSALGPRASFTASTNDVDITSIDTGSANSSVVGRQIWRTKSGADSFFLLTEITNNDDTTYTDNTVDGSLGEQYKDVTGFAKDEQLNFWINHYNKDIAQRTHYLVQNTSHTSVSAASITTSGDILTLKSPNFRMSWRNNSGKIAARLKPVDTKDLDNMDPEWELSSVSGTPAHVYRESKVGKVVKVWPPPDESATVSIRYTSTPNDLTADTSVVLASDVGNSASSLDGFVKVLVYGVASEMKRLQRRDQEGNNFFQLYQNGVQELRKFVTDFEDESQLPLTTNYPTEGARPEFEQESIPSPNAEIQKQGQSPQNRRRQRVRR